ncbi:MAG: aquaporin Z [Planctomycetes bacterium]|nr:aquaporin Z [Planctomycetota bacterium]
MSLQKRAVAEFIGTFWLVFGGCGTAVLAGHKVGWLGVSFAFGLTVLTMAYAIGHISGCHLNPAVTLGLTVGGRFDKKEVLPYWFAQVLGAIAAGGLLYFILMGSEGFVDKVHETSFQEASGGFATNGFGVRPEGASPEGYSPEGYSLAACLVAEVVLTMLFLLIILGSTDKRAPAGLAPIAIGLGLTLIHLIGIPITNTSVNPARSTSQAVFADGHAWDTLWLFWAAPLAGAIVAGFIYRYLFDAKSEAQGS